MNEPNLTDAEREVITGSLRACRVGDGAPVGLLKEHDLHHVTWMVTRAVEPIVAARVVEAVDRERAAWVAKVREVADEWDWDGETHHVGAIHAGIVRDLRALLAADDTEGKP